MRIPSHSLQPPSHTPTLQPRRSSATTRAATAHQRQHSVPRENIPSSRSQTPLLAQRRRRASMAETRRADPSSGPDTILGTCLVSGGRTATSQSGRSSRLPMLASRTCASPKVTSRPTKYVSAHGAESTTDHSACETVLLPSFKVYRHSLDTIHRPYLGFTLDSGHHRPRRRQRGYGMGSPTGKYSPVLGVALTSQLWWSIWLSVVWLGFWAATAAFLMLPSIFHATIGAIAPTTRAYTDVVRALGRFVTVALAPLLTTSDSSSSASGPELFGSRSPRLPSITTSEIRMPTQGVI